MGCGFKLHLHPSKYQMKLITQHNQKNTKNPVYKICIYYSFAKKANNEYFHFLRGKGLRFGQQSKDPFFSKNVNFFILFYTLSRKNVSQVTDFFSSKTWYIIGQPLAVKKFCLPFDSKTIWLLE